ncbi:TPA: restriction endonuclease subunit S [Vibrio parahaemolyticus]|nr:restriction endonuclease subunit S [Vibrio parahaemolyticus]
MVPNGWSLKLISDTAKVITGNTPSTKDSSYYNGDIPFVSPADLGANKLISSANKTLTKKGFEKSRAVRKGSTLFTCIGSTIGKLGQANCELATNQQINAVIPYSSFDDDFIYYQLEMRAKFISKLAGTQAVPIINKTTFESQNLLVPDSLPEQRKIAQILSTWDNAISTTEKLIETSKQQKKALMQQLLTGKKRLVNPETGKAFEGEWAEVKLGEICTPQQWATISSKELLEDGFPVYGANGHIGYFSEYNHELETVAVTCRGSTCGEVFLIPERSYITGNAMCLDNINEKVHSYKFVFYALTYRGFKDVISGSAQPQIVGKAIKAVKFVVPTILEQQKIASVLTAADKEIEVLETKLAHFKQEKKALMQQLLTGKRRVKVDEEVAA